jgi:hypothetical protein
LGKQFTIVYPKINTDMLYMEFWIDSLTPTMPSTCKYALFRIVLLYMSYGLVIQIIQYWLHMSYRLVI